MIKTIVFILCLTVLVPLSAQNGALEYRGHFTEKNKADHRKLEGGNLNNKNKSSILSTKNSVKKQVSSIIQNKPNNKSSSVTFKNNLAKAQVHHNTRRELTKLNSVLKRHELTKKSKKVNTNKTTVTKIKPKPKNHTTKVKPRVIVTIQHKSKEFLDIVFS